MSTSGSLLPVVLRGARPGELPVVRWPQPVVPSAQLVDHRAVTTTRSTRLLQPWQRHSEVGAAASAEAVVPRPARARSDGGDCDSAPEFAGRRLPASVITSCVGIERTEGRRDLGHQAAAWPGVPVITSLPANALLRFVHLNSLVDDFGGRCSANGAEARLQRDRRALRCRIAWMSESAAALGAQIRPSREPGHRQRRCRSRIPPRLGGGSRIRSPGDRARTVPSRPAPYRPKARRS